MASVHTYMADWDDRVVTMNQPAAYFSTSKRYNEPTCSSHTILNSPPTPRRLAASHTLLKVLNVFLRP